jgi:putative ABC transport system permease protein
MFLMLFTSAVQSLRGNLLRTTLAMLGVIIGVAAVVAMLGIGSGAQKQIMSRFNQEGTTVLSAWTEWRARNRRALTPMDAEAILHQVPGVTAVAPWRTWGNSVSLGDISFDTTIIATTDTWFNMGQGTMAMGRPFKASEDEFGTTVAVLGATTAATLFNGIEPLGAKVRIGSVQFTVVGVLRLTNSQTLDNGVLLPLNTARRTLWAFGNLNAIHINAASVDVLDRVQNDVGKLLLRRHYKRSADERDFSIWINRDILEKYREFSSIFRALLAGVAAVSMLVGGIGIMNVMLMTVAERTREIGLRKAIGAREGDIRNQFLVEAVLTTTLGGTLGVAAGAGIMYAAKPLLPFPPEISSGAVLLAIGFSVAVGLFFGYYPASRAARLDPIEALRYE